MLVLASPIQAQASAAPVRPPFTIAAGRPAGLADRPGTVLDIDPAAVAALRGAERATVTLPLAAGESITLDLQAWDPFAPNAIVTWSDERGAHPLTPDVSLYRGTVAGAEASSVVMAFTPEGVIGVVSWDGRRYGIGPLAGAPRLHLIGEAVAPARPDFGCGAEDFPLPIPPKSGGLELQGMPDGVRIQTTDRLWLDLAVECDYEYYANKMGSNLSQAVSYITALVGAVSGVYETDINVSVRISYLNIWTTVGDPYTAANTSGQLPEFQNWFNGNRSTVSRQTAHLISGRNLGGGIAYLSVLCNRGQAYGVSQVDGIYSYPSSATTWDAYVLAHELGHNFSSPHTHSCFWQSNGYAAPGTTLDSCYTSEGGCYTGPFFAPQNGGTVMSYCHLQGPLHQTIRMEFHPTCRLVMRQHAEACLPAGAFDPQIALEGAAAGAVITLTWHPSPAPGVVRYDVYRSGVVLSLAPQLVGSTTDTTFQDPGRIGEFYYRVRAVRASDESAFSNEVRIEACTQSATAFYAAGGNAVSPVVADWNQDGIRDVIVANNSPGGPIQFLAGNGSAGVGDGTFAAPVPDTAGTRPSALVTADFDEDGRLDLAVANQVSSGVVGVLLSGNATGGDLFGPPVFYAVGSNPVGIVVSDFNEDGAEDLAITNSGSSNVSVLLGITTAEFSGIGSGAFAAATSYSVGSGPVGLTVADFDQDDILDLAVVKSTGAFSLVRGNGSGGRGDGTFTVGAGFGTGSGASSITSGDFDENGIRDVAVTRHLSPGFVSVLLGLGGGVFATRVEYPAGNFPSTVIAADYNADGIADLVATGNESPGRFAVLFGHGMGNTGDGTFDAAVFRTLGALPGSLAAADFNEDGGPDLALAHTANGDNLGVVLATCGGSVDGSLQITSPNGGESWPVSTEQTITWSRGPRITAVDVLLSRDQGATWETIARGVTDSSVVWTVTFPSTAPDQALVRVIDPLQAGDGDQSDAFFTIGAHPLLDAAPVKPLALAFDRVYPNPARDRLMIGFALPRAGDARLELIDVAGRRVARRDVGGLGAGRHTVDLARGMRLESGLYFVRLTQGDRGITTRAVVAR